jgi:hypothetical protein
MHFVASDTCLPPQTAAAAARSTTTSATTLFPSIKASAIRNLLFRHLTLTFLFFSSFYIYFCAVLRFYYFCYCFKKIIVEVFFILFWLIWGLIPFIAAATTII